MEATFPDPAPLGAAPADPPTLARPAAPLAAEGPPAAGEVADEALVDALARMGAAGRERLLGEHGFVRLVDAMPRLVEAGGLGPEAAVVQAARVSTGAGTKTAQADEALLRYLYRHEHFTPFEMVVLKFSVRAPIFTARQWMRHRAGSYNEQSARFGVVPTDFYLPETVGKQSLTNKQGSGASLPAEGADAFRTRVQQAYDAAEAAYTESLEAGVARETARIVMPEGRYTTFYWTVNLRNLFHFLELRMALDAQDNIRQYACAICDILRGYCPLAVRAFEDYQLHAVRLTALEIDALKRGEPSSEMSAREQTEWAKKQDSLFSK